MTSKIPEDSVPRPPLTLETLRKLNDTVDQQVTVHEPGEMIFDAEGLPLGFTEGTSSQAIMAPGIFLRAELDRLGGHPDDFPNLRFIDPPTAEDDQ